MGADGFPRAADAPLSTLTVIELPPDDARRGGRAHHALNIPFDGARSAVRALGVGATECALQVRAPTRVLRAPVAGARPVVDIQAQLRLACRM